MGEKYDVDVELKLKNTAKAETDTKRVSNAVQELADKVRGVQNPVMGMVRSLLGIGAAYVGVSAISHAFIGASKGAFGFQAELERTKIGLASVLSATQGYDFATGMKEGSKIFRELSDDAIKSTATTKQLFDIYQGIVGPITAAGKGLSTVRQITNDTVSASGALGEDFAQASRDINMMIRGRAGAEVMLFSKLKSVGAIKETAEAFNKLTTTQRIDKLQVALGKFAPAADAYGKSWAGVTSSFTDIVQQLSAAAYGPAFESIKKFVGGVNDRLLAHREAITAYMTRIGSVLGKALDSVFNRADKALNYVVDHWKEISDKIDATVNKIREMVPHLLKAAKAFAEISLARSIAAPAIAGAGMAIRGAEMLGIVGGGVAAGSAAAGATAGGAAAAGGAGAAGAAVAGIGTAGALAAAGVALAALVGVGLAIAEQFEPLKSIFMETFVPLGKELWGLAQAVGVTLLPILKVFGHIIILALGPALAAGTVAMRLLVGGLRIGFEWLGKWTNHLYEKMLPTIDRVYLAFAKITKFMSGFADFVLGEGAFGPRQSYRGMNDPSKFRMDQDQKAPFRMSGEQFQIGPQQEYKGKTPTVVNDFRGSKIEVRQEFKDADPDRVLIQMVDDLNRQADMRIRSSYAPALAGG